MSARSIQDQLAIEQANLSQHPAILRSHVFYSLRSEVLLKVLDLMRDVGRE